VSNKEHALLSHIIRHGAVDRALELGLTTEDFKSGEGAAIFKLMQQVHRDRTNKGGQLGVNAIKDQFPEFVFCDDKTTTLELYFNMVRKERHLRTNASIARALVDIDDDPVVTASNCAHLLQQNVLSVGYGQRDDVSFADSIERSITDHDLRKSGVNMAVCEWPWEPFNLASGGIEQDDYIVLYGRPKSKKSWVLAEMISHVFNNGKVPLIYTKEMTADNIFKRVGACLQRLPYQDFRLGRLSDYERARLTQLLELARDVRQYNKDMICLDGKDTDNGDTIEWLTAKVKRYQPDIVFIDGLYLMSDNKGSRGQKDNFRVQNISRAARQMVLETKTPLVVTMQATRTAASHKGANLDEIAYSDAIGQDVTTAIRVINEDPKEIEGDPDADVNKPKITMVVGGSREFRFDGCQIYGVPATDFSYIRNLSSKEIESARQRDDRQDEKASGQAALTKAKAKGLTAAQLTRAGNKGENLNYANSPMSRKSVR
jgi:replicative DNA helicase